MPRKAFPSEVRRHPGDEELFGSWAKGYEDGTENESDAGSYFRGLERRFKEIGVDVRKSKVLEIGSGNNIFLNYLQKQGIDATGVDARPRGKTEGLPVAAARLEQLPFPDESFDIILSNQVFDLGPYNQDQRMMMEEIARTLRHGGIWVAITDRIKEPIATLTNINPEDNLVKMFRKP